MPDKSSRLEHLRTFFPLGSFVFACDLVSAMTWMPASRLRLRRLVCANGSSVLVSLANPSLVLAFVGLEFRPHVGRSLVGLVSLFLPLLAVGGLEVLVSSFSETSEPSQSLLILKV